MSAPTLDRSTVAYPESDGKPMAENTVQFRWVVTIKEGIDALLRDDPNVFVAGDLLWYPVEHHPEISVAPDAMVAFGRPKGDRGSYRQWEEENVAPQVVFEVLSPSNTPREMAGKLRLYEQYGVEEYYIYAPDRNRLEGWRREGAALRSIGAMAGWTSPRLGVRFDWTEAGLRLIRPDGRPLETYDEVERRAERLAERLRALGLDPDAP